MDFNSISTILLWVVVIIQSVVIYALLRQVAPEMRLQTLDNRLIDIAGTQRNKSQLIFFMSPDCPVCKSLLPALKSAVKTEAKWIDVVLASDGNTVDHQAFVRNHKLESLPYVVSEILGKSHGVAKLPYGVLIDEKGEVAAMGILNSREHLDSLFEAKELNIASIQDYMQAQSDQAEVVEVKP